MVSKKDLIDKIEKLGIDVPEQYFKPSSTEKKIYEALLAKINDSQVFVSTVPMVNLNHDGLTKVDNFQG